MKPQVNFVIPSEDGEMVLEFNKVEEIDEVIETLEMCRAELEHQIEMERQRRREKKKRAKVRKKNGEPRALNLNEVIKSLEENDSEVNVMPIELKKAMVEAYNELLKEYKKLDKETQDALRPYMKGLELCTK